MLPSLQHLYIRVEKDEALEVKNPRSLVAGFQGYFFQVPEDTKIAQDEATIAAVSADVGKVADTGVSGGCWQAQWRWQEDIFTILCCKCGACSQCLRPKGIFLWY